MTWITDGSGTRWVPVVPRKRRKPPRALRFADLKPGDVVTARSKWTERIQDPACARVPGKANDNTRDVQRSAVHFALVEHIWDDPVAGESDPTAGRMVAIRPLTPRGPSPSLTRHTLRGLASNGYHPTTPEQAALILRWMAERDRLVERFEAGEITAAEARMEHRPWRLLLTQLGLKEDL